MTHQRLSIDSQWHIYVDSEVPALSAIGRGDDRFFSVQFNKSQGFIQPVVVEKSDGRFCGTVIPLICRAGGELCVLVKEMQRPGEDSALVLLEATRFSLSNPLFSDQTADINLGNGRLNSARILGEVLCAVIVAPDNLAPPDGSSWMSFQAYATETTDMPGQAVLFRYLMWEARKTTDRC
ncbi:hypothetical protein BH10CYA1_BH10CYA1_53540 [soil metagenome]